ncbi:hypothetical protein ACLB2K_029932 [Fragaria x ananassa]
MATSQEQTNRARALWLTCLASALRTALACTIVAIITLYGPPSLRHLALPAFSYVTVILIVPDATLGDTLRGFWLAHYATIQSVGPAILSLWLIGPACLTTSTTALAVGLAAFVVVLPGEATHLVSKRTALAQIVLVYVIAFIKGGSADAIMHPVHVAASTAVGVLACVLALLVPFPRLACREVKQNSKLLVENASERLKLFVKAFCAEDNASAIASISQTKSLASTATKLFQTIKRHQESMQWERLPLTLLRHSNFDPGNRLQGLETPLKGMEMALSSTPSFPVGVVDGELKSALLKLVEEQMSLNRSIPCEDAITVPESKPEIDISLKFWYYRTGQLGPSAKKRKQLLHVNKVCKENGCWSGLPVAISFAAAREATFKVANVKAQGTVLGTVYGVFGCFLFHRILPIRILSLIPWFIFTSFLQRSKMYGQAGCITCISAVIGAVLILGRTKFGSPSEFAIAIITETFIGLSCSIFVELLLQPTRASTVAKVQLSRTLGALHECIDSVTLQSGRAQLEDSQKCLKLEVEELGKLIAEADVEPNFWFLPFHTASYGKLMSSISKMMELLVFSGHAIGVLEQNSQLLQGSWKGIVATMECDLELFKMMVGSLISCFRDITLLKSMTVLEREGLDDQESGKSCDLELGKPQTLKAFRVCGLEDEEMNKIVSSYLLHSKEAVDKIHCQQNEELKGQIVLCLSAIGFSESGLIRGTREIEEGIKELVQWENPSSHVNFFVDPTGIQGFGLSSTEANLPLQRGSKKMATNSSNGEHQTTTKQPPLPSPLRFSKFFQSNMRILVTGGAGFIGSHLIDRLMENEKNEVIVVDNYFTGSKDNLKKWIGHPRFELIRHDVTETLLVEVDQIYHLACPASPIFYKYNPVKFDVFMSKIKFSFNSATIKTNVIGTLNMLGLAKRVGARILLTSTSEVYGDPLVHPQPESYWGNVNPIGVRSCYDEGKRVAETLMFDYHRQHGIEIRIARIFNTYGPRMNIDDGRVVSNFIAQALRDEPLTVQNPGTQTRSFCYVSDMVDGLIRLMEGEHTGPINIGNPGEFTMLELAETVKELINPQVEIKRVENTPDDPRQRKPDITKAKELLGWEPKITLREGLPLMEEDFRLRLGAAKKN